MQYIFLVAAIIYVAYAAVDSDEVTNLPGLTFKPTFKHYSGYLQATGTKKLHYWFVESQRDPKSDPLVLWLNGGPGCSSMDGLLTEHGPFRVSSDGKSINNNPWSWNKISNMLYIEAPAGVGYSYSDDKDYSTDDDQVAKDNHAALKTFMNLYPEFAKHDLYLTGESYGGIYIPTLSNLVMEDSSMNLKGIAVGNGMSDYQLNDKSLMYFGYFHGLWGRTLEQKLVKNCCKDGNLTNCKFDADTSRQCSDAVRTASGIIGGINVYNMYAECYSGEQYFGRRHRVSSHAMMLSGSSFFKNQTSRFYALQRSGDVEVSPPCIDSRGITTFLNQADVRTALHIPQNLPQWEVCSGVVGVLYKRVYNNMFEQYRKLLAPGKYRVLVYNGDVDMACNFLMDEWFVDSLSQDLVDDYAAWRYTAADGSNQVGGYAKYFKNLAFVTVRGAGHMVPTDRPIPAYHMFEAFMEGRRL